jgi:excisionase family DNA binding protein
MPNEDMTTKEVAEVLKCSVMTVTKLVKRGHFPGARKFDPTRRNSPLSIPRAEVLAYQEKQLISPKSDE